MGRGEAAVPTIQVKVGTTVDLLLLSISKRFNNFVLPRDHLGHVHLNLPWVNSKLGTEPGVVGDPRAGDHGFGGCAAVVDAGASKMRFFHEGHIPTQIR
jgi:hypothetical protein